VLQKPLAFVISKSRAGKSQEAYKRIGGGSPIGAYTRQQAQILEQKLRKQGLDAKCYIAMRYWHPLTADTVRQMQQDGVGRVVVLPLYPQYSISTTGSSLRELAKHIPSQLIATTTVMPFWYDRAGYIGAVSDLIGKELATFSVEERSHGVHVLFSAHGVPKVGELLCTPCPLSCTLWFLPSRCAFHCPSSTWNGKETSISSTWKIACSESLQNFRQT
jgi:ferrochelatase